LTVSLFLTDYFSIFSNPPI